MCWGRLLAGEKIICHLSLDIFHLLIWKEKPGRLRDPANKQMTNVQ
jgi:hypothetical protein